MASSFPQELSRLGGPSFLGVSVLLVIRDAVFWDVSRDFLRFRQRANALVVVELLRGRVFSFSKNVSCVLSRKRQLFRQVSRGSLDRENVKTPEQVPPLASSCEADNGIQVFLLFACRIKSTQWRQFQVAQRRIPVLLRPCSLIALRANLYHPPLQAIRAASAHSAQVG